MSSPEAAALPAPDARYAWLTTHWPLLAGFACILVPTFITLGREAWSMEAGAHGPIVLATGIWLLWRNGGLSARTTPGLAPWLVIMALLPLLAVWIGGHAYDLLLLEAGAIYAIALLLGAYLAGWRTLLSNPFPYLYLGFLVPIPGWVLAAVTAPLQQFVSWAATSVLALFDYPVAREGVVITIAQYQLLVEEACAGMNSLIGLIAISMFYIYILYRASWRHAAILLAMIVPIAIFVNIVRVTTLILLTYHAGDAVAQGFLHVTAGMVLFAGALGLMVLVDMAVRRMLGTENAGAL
jgi:exosortase